MDDTMMTDDNQDSLAGISPGVQDSGVLRSSFLTGALMGGHQDSPDRSPKRQRVADTRQRMQEPGPVDVKSFARGIATSNGSLKLGGSDALIVGTERILENLAPDVSEMIDDQQLASLTARELLRFWNKLYPLDPEDVIGEEVGPSVGQPSAISASMLAHLLLPLYHPAAAEPQPSQKARLEQSLVVQGTRQAVPKVLIEWLAAFHEPGSDVVDAVRQSKGCYAEVTEFWDGVMSSLIRGRLSHVIAFLQGANFRKISDQPYTNPQLDYIDEAIDAMLELLEKNPAVQSDDWDVKGPSWAIFRRQVGKTQAELREMLEGDDEDSENVGRNQLSFGLSQTSRAAESRLPQDIYDSLNDICEMLRGDPYAIKNAAFDWVEAVMCLTIWWDGEEGADLSQSSRRRSMSASTHASRRPRQSRQADVTPTLAYRQRLTDAFRMVLDEEDLAEIIDWNSPLQVAICSIFEDEVDSALSIIKSQSITIASAIADVGSLGGWISVNRTQGLDEQDLMVLSYAENSSKPGTKDDLLQNYAKLLATRKIIEDKQTQTKEEGWYLALSVLSRMDDVKLSSVHATNLVENISLNSNGQVDNLLDSCSRLGFDRQLTLVAVVSCLT
jgi:hypothetical protein